MVSSYFRGKGVRNFKGNNLKFPPQERSQRGSIKTSIKFIKEQSILQKPRSMPCFFIIRYCFDQFATY